MGISGSLSLCFEVWWQPRTQRREVSLAGSPFRPDVKRLRGLGFSEFMGVYFGVLHFFEAFSFDMSKAFLRGHKPNPKL